MLGRVIRFVTLAAVAGSVAQLPATVASAEELAPRTVLVQPADMPLSRDGLSGLAASVAGTDVAEVLSGALKAASGQRIVGGAVTPQDAATALSRLPSSPYTDRIMYAANGSLMVLDFLSEATVFRARMATISLPDGVASILGTASAVAEGSGIALTAQGPDGTTQYSSVVAAGDNECKIHCFGASLTISILTGVVCFILFPTPAGAAAALVCGLALAVAGTAFNEVCPRFAAICDDGPGGAAFTNFNCIPGECIYKAVASNLATLVSTSVTLDYLRAGYLDYDVQYTTFNLTRSVKGLADNHYLFEGSWPTPYYGRSATSVFAYGVVGWSNGKYQSARAASAQVPS